MSRTYRHRHLKHPSSVKWAEGNFTIYKAKIDEEHTRVIAHSILNLPCKISGRKIVELDTMWSDVTRVDHRLCIGKYADRLLKIYRNGFKLSVENYISHPHIRRAGYRRFLRREHIILKSRFYRWKSARRFMKMKLSMKDRSDELDSM